jgi:hypothetical protein
MPIQDLYQALQMFNQGAQEFAVSQTLMQSRDEMKQMHNQLLAQNASEEEKQNQMQLFANDLALRLGAASGGNAALVDGIAGRFGITAGQQAQQNFANQQMKQNQDFQREMSDREFAHQQSLMGMQLSSKQMLKGKALGTQMTPIAPISEDDEKKLKVSAEKVFHVNNLLEDYEKLLANEGTAYVGRNSARLEAMQGRMRMSFKDLFDLGALQAADLEALEPLLPDATGKIANIKGMFGGYETGQIKTKIQEMRKELLNRTASNMIGRGAMPAKGSALEVLFNKYGVQMSPQTGVQVGTGSTTIDPSQQLQGIEGIRVREKK